MHMQDAGVPGITRAHLRACRSSLGGSVSSRKARGLTLTPPFTSPSACRGLLPPGDFSGYIPTPGMELKLLSFCPWLTTRKSSGTKPTRFRGGALLDERRPRK